MEEVKYIGNIATSQMNPTYEDILKANSAKSEKIRKTPIVYSPTFSMLCDSKVYLKSEEPTNRQGSHPCECIPLVGARGSISDSGRIS